MKALVTGGGGFLGSALCRALLARGYAVRSLSRGDYPALVSAGVECVRGDIADSAAVLKAVAGVDVVFHVAAKAGVWGRVVDYEQANIVGTQNVLDACRGLGVRKLIYTSSPSVVYAGENEAGLDESAPYPAHYLTDYPRTKAEAERRVRAANGPALATVSLRPHLIWGPGDNHLLPRLLEKARAGRLRQVGNGKNLVDTTYIDNAVAAHLSAYDRLSVGSPCAGKVYFIANDSPTPLWELINRMLACAELPPVTLQVSPEFAYRMGAVLEGTYKVLGIPSEPPMTRFVARQLATDHWYDLTAAKRDLGYVPAVSVDEGLVKLRAWIAAGMPSVVPMI